MNGTASRYYTTMETNLQKDVRGSITLTDGSKLPFRLIGILHDDLADGSGRKAGLTFMAVNAMPNALRRHRHLSGRKNEQGRLA